MRGYIERRDEGVYRLRWYIKREAGKIVLGSKTIRGTKKAAERAMREICARKDRGITVPSPSKIPTLREYAKAWKEAGAEAAGGVRARTFEGYVADLERYVLPRLGDLRLDEIRTARIEREVMKPLRDAKKHRTAQLVKAALSKLMASAVKDEGLGLVGNPCHGVGAGGGTKRQVEPMNKAERDGFREAIRGKRHEAFFLLLMGTGVRPSEARALDWSAVDLAAGAFRVERSVDDKRRFHEPKTKKARRTVPIQPEVLQALLELCGRKVPESGLVFADRKGRPLDRTNLLRRHFRPALERVRLGKDKKPLEAERVKELRLYDLRHGFATAALEAGEDVKTTSELLGHQDVRLTMNTYQHVSDERRREAVQRIGEQLFGGADSGVVAQGVTQSPPDEVGLDDVTP